MLLRKLLASVAAVAFASAPLWAQNSKVHRNAQPVPHGTIDTIGRSKSDMLLPRPDMVPRQSLVGVPALDTLDTSSPGVKIILYADNTWYYYRDPAVIMKKEVFSRYWSDQYPDPYKLELKDLPDKIKIWVVDSLSQFKCPRQIKVFSPYGYRHRRRHSGVDLPLHTGDPVYAAFSGKVRMSKYYKGYGNLVILRHENGLETFYGHLSKRHVDVGDWVEAGDVIGLGGSTGRSTGPHLHFETRFEGYSFDPQWLIDFEQGTLRTRLFILRKKYLSANSKYVPESIQEEDDINEGDERDYAEAKAKHEADSIAAAKAAAEAAAAKYHTIRQGDTLGALARKYHTSVRAICRLNKGLTENTVLRLGRKIRVK